MDVKQVGKPCKPDNIYAPLAQLAEQRPFKVWVGGSNPLRRTRNTREIVCFFYFIYEGGGERGKFFKS